MAPGACVCTCAPVKHQFPRSASDHTDYWAGSHEWYVLPYSQWCTHQTTTTLSRAAPCQGIRAHAWALPLSAAPISALLPFPSRTSTYSWEFPSLQAVGKPGLALLPPPTTTLSCSSLCSATSSQNQWLFLQLLRSQAGSFQLWLLHMFPCCPAAVYVRQLLHFSVSCTGAEEDWGCPMNF